MSVDPQKLKKEAAKAKRKAIAAKSQKKTELIQEEKELKAVKSEYDRAEHIRRKLLNDLISKELTDDRFTRLYDNFYETYMDDDNMELFMILVRLSYDYDTKGFVELINKVLKSIKSKESGALVKGKKGSTVSNFYESSSILELLNFIDGKDKVIEQYNKRKFQNSSGVYKISEKFGTIDQVIKLQKRLLEKIYQDSVRLTNLWRKKVEEDVDLKGKKYREVQYDEKDLQEETEDERLRYQLLLELSSLENKEEIETFFSILDENLNRYSNNNNLFKELLYIYDISDIKDLKKYIGNVIESYDDNHNTILALLETVKNTKVLRDRYGSVRKAIKKEFRTLENKYGPLDEFLDLKKMEFLSMERGMKYQEIVKEEKDIKVDKKDKDNILEEYVRDAIFSYKDNISDMSMKVLKSLLLSNGLLEKDFDENKAEIKRLAEIYIKQREEIEEKKEDEIPFYPLKGDKDRGKGKVKRKEKKEKSEEIYIMHNLDTKLNDFSKEQLEKLRNVSVYFLKKFFDLESSKDMEKHIFKENSENTLRSYLTRLGKLIILVDPSAMKNVAKLLNERLSDGYYDLKDILNLSYKELLQDVYADPLNKDFQELETIIDFELNKFFKNFIRSLGFVQDNLLDEDIFGPDYTKIYRIDNIEPCNIEFKGRTVFKKYLKLKSDYNLIDQDNQKEKLEALKLLLDEEKKIRPFLRSIVYYKENDQLYCFTYFELEERFNEKDYQNPYTGNNFSQDFIEDLRIVIKSKQEKVKKNIKDEEQEEQETKFLRNILDDINALEVELKDKVSKDDACNYYKKFVFPSSELEKIMKKEKAVVNQLKTFCGVIRKEDEPKSDKNSESESDVPKPEMPEVSNIQKSPRSQLSIPSIVFGEDLKEKQKPKADISLPMLSPKSPPPPVVSSIPEQTKTSTVSFVEPSKVSKASVSVAEISKVSKPSSVSVAEPSKASSVSVVEPSKKSKKDKKMLLEMLSKKLEPDL